MVPAMCPGCGHHTSQALGGCCTVLVPDSAGRVGTCGCDCARAATGESLHQQFARRLHHALTKENP